MSGSADNGPEGKAIIRMKLIIHDKPVTKLRDRSYGFMTLKHIYMSIILYISQVQI